MKDRLTETMPNGKKYDVLNITTSSGDNTGIFTVPEGHLFVMGDNRDNSLDSRYPKVSGGLGFVAVKDILYTYED